MGGESQVMEPARMARPECRFQASRLDKAGVHCGVPEPGCVKNPHLPPKDVTGKIYSPRAGLANGLESAQSSRPTGEARESNPQQPRCRLLHLGANSAVSGRQFHTRIITPARKAPSRCLLNERVGVVGLETRNVDYFRSGCSS